MVQQRRERRYRRFGSQPFTIQLSVDDSTSQYKEIATAYPELIKYLPFDSMLVYNNSSAPIDIFINRATDENASEGLSDSYYCNAGATLTIPGVAIRAFLIKIGHGSATGESIAVVLQRTAQG